MAEIRQGYLDDYIQSTSGNIGIGTSVPNEKLEIIGGVTSQELSVTGIATLTSISGFVKKHADHFENVSITIGDSGTLSGEVNIGAGLTMTVGTGATSSQGSIDSLKVSKMFQPPSGGTNQRPAGKPGALFYNFDFKTIEFFDGSSWRQVDNTSRSSRGILGGGTVEVPSPFYVSTIRHINIMSQGNAISGGDLLAAATRVEACGSSTRTIFAGGYTPSNINTIQYRATASDGNTIQFGSLSQGRNSHFGSSSSTRAVFGGGYSTNNSIDYVQISTLGDHADFGDLSFARHQNSSVQSGTRAVLGGGTPGNGDGIMNYLHFASRGNTVFFGNLTTGRRDYGGGGNSVRGLYCGGASSHPRVNTIDFISIASNGNATYFGDLTVPARSTNCCDNQVRTVIVGKGASPVSNNIIDYVTISSTGTAADFGNDIFVAMHNTAGTSDSHGGLGGY